MTPMKTMGVFLEANGRCAYTVITGASFENASPLSMERYRVPATNEVLLSNNKRSAQKRY